MWKLGKCTVNFQWCNVNKARRALQLWDTVEQPLIYWNINKRSHLKTFHHPHGTLSLLMLYLPSMWRAELKRRHFVVFCLKATDKEDLTAFSFSSLKLCIVLNETHFFPALPTSWCIAACLPLWSAAACLAWSCCEPRTSCRCERRCRGSRSCWPSGCSDAARPWVLWTLTSRPSSSVWRRHQWCTPAGGGNPEKKTHLKAWGRRCALFFNA